MITVLKNDEKELRFKKEHPKDTWNKYHDIVNVYGKDGESMFHNFFIDPIKLFKKIGKQELKDKLFAFWFHYGYKRFKILDIDESFFEKFDYTCAYNGFKHRSIMPICIISDNDAENKYSNFLENYRYKKMLLDKEWQLSFICDPNDLNDENISDNEFFQILLSNLSNMQSKISQLKMGSGYTEFCLDSDGSYSDTIVALKLSNGDYMICKILLWFNK